MRTRGWRRGEAEVGGVSANREEDATVARVLIVYHSLSGNTKAAAEAVAEGAEAGGANPVLKEGLQAGPEDLRACDAIAIGTPDYFSYMAGGLKDFFDRSFYPTQGQVVDKPCGIFVTHGGGGKAVESVKSICATFRFKVVVEPVLVQNRPDKAAAAQLKALGKTLAAAGRK
jgi:multimeric flavodoxin WrbA